MIFEIPTWVLVAFERPPESKSTFWSCPHVPSGRIARCIVVLARGKDRPTAELPLGHSFLCASQLFHPTRVGASRPMGCGQSSFVPPVASRAAWQSFFRLDGLPLSLTVEPVQKGLRLRVAAKLSFARWVQNVLWNLKMCTHGKNLDLLEAHDQASLLKIVFLSDPANR